MYPNPQSRWSEKTIVLDCLSDMKCLAEHDSRHILEASSPAIRNCFERMFNDHTQMAREFFQIAQGRGWYPKPVQAVREHEQQLVSQFQPVGGGQQPTYQGYTY